MEDYKYRKQEGGLSHRHRYRDYEGYGSPVPPMMIGMPLGIPYPSSYSSSKLTDDEIDDIKNYIIGASLHVNVKLMALSTAVSNSLGETVMIKFTPLAVYSPEIKQNSSNPYVNTIGSVVVDGFSGSFKYPTTIPLNNYLGAYSFLLAPMNGVNGENYKQRIDKIKQYIKFYKTIKGILEKWIADASGDVKKLKALMTRYVTFGRDSTGIMKWAGIGKGTPIDTSDDNIIDEIADYKIPTASTGTSTGTITSTSALKKKVDDLESKLRKLLTIPISPTDKFKKQKDFTKIFNDVTDLDQLIIKNSKLDADDSLKKRLKVFSKVCVEELDKLIK